MTKALEMDNVLFGMGNPLLDISAAVDHTFLEKYGLKSNDAIMAEEKHMGIYSDLVSHYKVDYVAGGAAQNTIRGAQWLLPPGSTCYTGCVGKDKFGKTLRETSQNAGIKVAYMETDASQTGTCAVCITKQDRSMVANLAACERFDTSHLSSTEVRPLIEKARFFYIEGYFLTHGVESALYLAKHVADSGGEKRFIMNISAPFVPQFFKKQVEAVLPYWDVVFGNETEAEAFAESFQFETSDLEEIALKISQMPKVTSGSRMVVITHGSKPTIVAYENKVSTFPVMPIDPESIVDSNGAGDAFCSGFIAQLIRRKPLEDCIRVGNYAANVVLKRLGPTFPQSPPTISL